MWLKEVVDFGTVDKSGLKFKMSKNKVKCVGKQGRISRRRHTKRHVKQLTIQRRRLELSDRQVATVEVHERRQEAGGNKTRKAQNHQETGH